jgi:hypothetical protein
LIASRTVGRRRTGIMRGGRSTVCRTGIVIAAVVHVVTTMSGGRGRRVPHVRRRHWISGPRGIAGGAIHGTIAPGTFDQNGRISQIANSHFVSIGHAILRISGDRH